MEQFKSMDMKLINASEAVKISEQHIDNVCEQQLEKVASDIHNAAKRGKYKASNFRNPSIGIHVHLPHERKFRNEYE